MNTINNSLVRNVRPLVAIPRRVGPTLARALLAILPLSGIAAWGADPDMPENCTGACFSAGQFYDGLYAGSSVALGYAYRDTRHTLQRTGSGRIKARASSYLLVA